MAESVTGMVRSYRGRVRREFEAAFAEDHTPHEVGASFGVGVFLTALPTLGLGLLVFVALVALFDRISKIAIFASVVVLNPAIKPAVYVGSYQLGDRLLGAEPIALFDGGLGTATDATLRLLVGNLLLAAVLAVVGYVVVRRLTVTYRRRDLEVVERLVDPDP
jgi:uncharacterized protein